MGEEQQNPQCHEYNPRRKDDHCKYPYCGKGPEARPHLLWDSKHQSEPTASVDTSGGAATHVFKPSEGDAPHWCTVCGIHWSQHGKQ